MQLNISYDFLPKSRTINTSLIMDHFGIDFETGSHKIVENLSLSIQAGQLVCLTGESGSGKSSLIKGISRQLQRVIDISHLDLGYGSLIDSLDTDFEESLRLLSLCGLSEARLMLRSPQELSDGQRYRFRLALALSKKPDWIIADEFTATLDRKLAKMISFNIRKICDQSETGFLLATTHKDIIDDLSPDLHLDCHLDGFINVTSVVEDEVKKNSSVSPINFGSALAPNPTGRTSLGGIIAPTNSAL